LSEEKPSDTVPHSLNFRQKTQNGDFEGGMENITEAPIVPKHDASQQRLKEHEKFTETYVEKACFCFSKAEKYSVLSGS
jgi:hypothetical protein